MNTVIVVVHDVAAVDLVDIIDVLGVILLILSMLSFLIDGLVIIGFVTVIDIDEVIVVSIVANQHQK